MARKRRWQDVTVGLDGPVVQKLDDIATATGSNRSDVIRLVLSQFVSDYGKEPEKQYENILEARLRKLENRLANLTVLAVRASAQTLYYMTLPYSRGGFPTRPLNAEAFETQWQKSRTFAGQFLKNATVDIPSPEADTGSQAS